ncbi:UDP-N-acetylglucosamine 2-epimerase [Shewanella sp. C32]|uniref:UDP-N-acetylglucosamine 2-epimerase n=1 Tax=Shewanella electrica TaxID=515560 RepID=A0ABT2FMT3_9GAMM|nr:UDP-N-acetylglucosamine 2-epimerase [Shewanella electrica]MCH1925784.1 UDP-N-acetylglucosamine 2-epimerase [Shewanella electrica]MCS4557331.1 UDP-N-acetylglucosamine 2-epimerase [Shewanella electrica]
MRYLLYAEQNYSYAILRPLQEAIRRRGDEAAWFLAGSEINHSYIHEDETKLENVRDVIAWRPDAVLVPGDHVPSFIPGIKVAIFHGFNVAKASRKESREHFNIRGYFDLYCTQGPNTTKGFEQLAKKYEFFSVRQTGWSALDPLFTNVASSTAKDNGKPTVLLCSTFTKKLSCAPLLVDAVRKMRDLDEWNWLVQFHPKMSPEIVAEYKALQNKNLTFVETDNVIPLLQQADLMICDTSSVMLMFLMQRKPVVTFRNQTREGNRKEHLINVTEAEKLHDTVTYALGYPAEQMSKIDEYIADTHPYTDGKSSERVLDGIDDFLEKDFGKLKRKPLNLIRNFKQRKKLGYWGL